MKKPLLLVLLVALLVALPACTCQMVGDRVEIDCYGDLRPCANVAYDIGSPDFWWEDAYVDELHFADVYLEIRPDLDFTSISAHGRPAQAVRGIFQGYVLPEYADDNQELFFEICVPDRWNGTSDIGCHVDGYIDGPFPNKNFELQLEWEYYTPPDPANTMGDLVPNTNYTENVVTFTDAWGAAFRSYHVEFEIDYDERPADTILPDDILAFRLIRVANAGDMACEFVVTHLGVVFERDKLGDRVP